MKWFSFRIRLEEGNKIPNIEKTHMVKMKIKTTPKEENRKCSILDFSLSFYSLHVWLMVLQKILLGVVLTF